jgi:hypothetical protein
MWLGYLTLSLSYCVQLMWLGYLTLSLSYCVQLMWLGYLTLPLRYQMCSADVVRLSLSLSY